MLLLSENLSVGAVFSETPGGRGRPLLHVCVMDYSLASESDE